VRVDGNEAVPTFAFPGCVPDFVALGEVTQGVSRLGVKWAQIRQSRPDFGLGLSYFQGERL